MSCCQSGSIAAARAGVRQAQLEIRQAPTHSADVAVAQVDLLQAGTRPKAIAAAQAEVKAAEASLEQAPAALKETELRVPFAGTAASLDAKSVSLFHRMSRSYGWPTSRHGASRPVTSPS